MTLDSLSLMEEGDERLVGGLDEHKLKGIAVEGNTLQGRDDRAESGAAGNYERTV